MTNKSKLATTILDMIDKYEVPNEYIEALLDAYTEGVKRGYLDASIKYFNQKELYGTDTRGSKESPRNQT